MPVGSSGTLGLTISFSENPMSHGGLPSPASCGVSMMAHSSAPTMPYSVPPTVPAITGSLKHGILLVPGMPSTETHAVTTFMDTMLHSVNTCNPEMGPAEFQQLLSLDSQDSVVAQSNVQETPFVCEQPTPAPPKGERGGGEPQYFKSGQTLLSRPYVCSYDNYGKSLQQHKHTGEKPTYVTGKVVHGSSSTLMSLDDINGSTQDKDHINVMSVIKSS